MTKVSRTFKSKLESGVSPKKVPHVFSECGHIVYVFANRKQNGYCPNCLVRIKKERESRRKEVLRWIGE